MIETIEIAPGYAISRLIRGGWQQHADATLDPDAEAARLEAFTEAGIAAFETADSYRGLDEAIRRMLAGRRAHDLAIPRIHTRITLPADVETGLARARTALGVDTLDLVQLQSWRLDEAALIDAALRLEVARAAGRLLHHGLMNVDADSAERVGKAGARPLTVQVQCSLLDRRALSELAPYALEHEMRLLAYGPLAGGFLSEKWVGRPDPGMTPGANAHFHREYRIIIELFGGWTLYQRLLAALKAIAASHRASIPTIALRWVLNQPGIAAALVGASSPERLNGWRDVFMIALSSRDKDAIEEILADAKGPLGRVGGLEREANSPFARAIAASEAMS